MWSIAGFNVLTIGLTSDTNYQSLVNYLFSISVFVPFRFMCDKLMQKHTIRINRYLEDKLWFYRFFDLQLFIIMAITMIGGILIRKFNLLSEQFIAVFLYCVNFYRYLYS